MNEQEPNPYNSTTGDKEWVQWRCSQFDEGFTDPTISHSEKATADDIQNIAQIEDKGNNDQPQDIS
ncbi:hypothetical protein KC946_02155 [Candidatus Saccharibacteria bacterium]|nr:hypothetical protein [Candidatus Saccharibacteria bacterium]